MSSNLSEKSTTTGGGPTHFLVRTTGEVVPLIAVDELPSTIEIAGAPRSLDLTSTVGMFNLGIIRATGQVYDVVQNKDKDVKTAIMQETFKEKSQPEEQKEK